MNHHEAGHCEQRLGSGHPHSVAHIGDRTNDSPRMPWIVLVLGALAFGAPSAQAQVSGTVVDDSTGDPIVGALVSLQASTERTETGADGTFTLDVPAGSPRLVAARQGYFNAGVTTDSPTTGVELRLEAVPTDDDPRRPLPGPEACSTCHATQVNEWRASAMSHAGTNTWVHDVFDGSGTVGGEGGFVYTRDSVHAEANAESECASCHQPELWLATPFSALEARDSDRDGVRNGVGCTICHRMADIDLSQPNAPGLYPGVVRMTQPADPDVAVNYGTLGDVDYSAPGMRASYNPLLGSEVCATCHQDANDPNHDGDFEQSDSVISEPTYLEWLNSPYGDPEDPQFAPCAQCHMPASEELAACSLSLPYSRMPGSLRSHRIEGTTPTYLDNAVEVALSADISTDENEVLVDVSITNDRTGHHVPTGVTIRNMILLVEAYRVSDEQVLESAQGPVVHDLGGIGDPADGYYAGLPGRLYGKINHNAAGDGPVFFTEATGIEEDNRIAPLATDETHYAFTIPPGGGVIEVRARLIYRRTWRALLDAKSWTVDGHGNALEDLSAPHFGHLMEERSTTLVAPAPAPDAGPPPALDGGEVDGGTDVENPPEGCGCRLYRTSPDHPWAAFVVLGLIGSLVRRRRS